MQNEPIPQLEDYQRFVGKETVERVKDKAGKFETILTTTG